MNLSIPQRLTEVALLFLKQGFTAFGGAAAHIAMMHDETVKRRKWLAKRGHSTFLLWFAVVRGVAA
jgi:chromate transport protein ChrA